MSTRILFLFGLGVLVSSMSAWAGSPQVYRGKWQSQSTGHQGPMRVKVTPRSDGNFDARFTGRFLVVVPFTYKTQLTNQGWSDAGQQLGAYRQLGPLLGSYQMSAQMTPATFNGSFNAAGDNGQVTMRRVR